MSSSVSGLPCGGECFDCCLPEDLVNQPVTIIHEVRLGSGDPCHLWKLYHLTKNKMARAYTLADLLAEASKLIVTFSILDLLI